MPNQKIACLGWGSLIWNSENLDISQDKWRNDGPCLPVEFTRQSNDGRMTLIIDKESESISVLWAVMNESNPGDAIEELKIRERTSKGNINFVEKDNGSKSEIEKKVLDWMRDKDENIDAVIWTGLSYSKHTDCERPDINEVISYLKGLKGDKRDKAKEYIKKAPKQIKTAYRKRIENELGWRN